MHQRKGETDEEFRIRSYNYLKDWRHKNPEKLREINHRSYERNIDKFKERGKRRREERRDEVSAYNTQYWKDNKKSLGNYRRDWNNRQYETDINFRILSCLRQRITSAVKRRHARKSSKTTDLIGCSVQFLKGYLEARFTNGMTWQNYGKFWHVDHIIPCAEFDMTVPDQQKQCFHYTNLRPLTAKENQSKGAKRPSEHQPEML